MAGAMRKMGIYLGLVEDDDVRAYGRYDARQSDYDDRADRADQRPGRERDRYGYDSAYDDGYADSAYPSVEYTSAEVPVEELAAPEPAPPRRSGPRRLDLAAPATVGPRSGGSTRAGSSVLAGGTATSGPVGATAAALATPEPAPAPAPAPVAATPKPYRISNLVPKTYNEARTIGERFRDGDAVLMNLAEMDDADAKRLVDFAAGLSFGLHGSIERVTAKVFLLSPAGTDVTAEDKARIREGGFPGHS
ncbi:cell division inhibitor SepF [Klenkia marina]|uniref:Cell division protein SepF n=1 Tax=Klenkia marina TaxID=1960309 RepID=A0A1G4Y9R9_9ACTN|nr:cell division protein SepF [Klenkia marina]SCX50247.1 cell division inhibitor SepF [Klenkia marina]